MMSALWVWAPIALATAALMDIWAAFLHGRVWHTVLWRVHRTHHTARRGFFETNDAFSLLHAPISMALIVWGSSASDTTRTLTREIAFGFGLGMALFGMGYLLIHDGVVHARLPVRFLGKLPYLRDVVAAHRIHHAGVRGGAPYGLFFGPWELARASRRAAEKRPSNRVAPSRGATNP